MAHDHGQHAGAVHRWRLIVALALAATFMVVEFVAAAVTGSLSLLSDAGHMLADVVTLAVATVATIVAARTRPSAHSTYGAYRAEVFASAVAVLIMLGTAVAVLIGAFTRGSDHEILVGPMLVVGAIGLVVNVVQLWILRTGAGESINVRGAYLEVMADALGSVGVIVAGVLVAWTGDTWWDAVLAVAIGAFVAVRAVGLGREVLHVLAQHAPHGMDLDEVEASLAALDGVTGVHDVHAWTLTSGMDVLTAHVLTGEGVDGQAVLRAARAMLADSYGLTHATLQIEAEPSGDCLDASW